MYVYCALFRRIFTGHGIPAEYLADRLSINLTLLLTAMAFKWVLAESLPPTPYLTVMEKYVIATFVILFVQGVSFWFLADALNYRCVPLEYAGTSGTPRNWLTGTNSTSESTFATLPTSWWSSCEAAHVVDRAILGIESICMIIKHFWFIARIFVNRKSAILDRIHFTDLSALNWWRMPGSLKWSEKELTRKSSDAIAHGRRGSWLSSSSSSSAKVGAAEV